MKLKELGIKHGTDKATVHSYLSIYENLFREKREEKLKILEIGAGCHGASHKMWKDYFVNSEIYCIDVFHYQREDLKEEMEKYGINVFIGNQLSRSDLKNFIDKFGIDYDIIIDDGAHMPDAIQLSLGVLFPFLKSGGLYIVEDLITASDRQGRISQVNANIEGVLNIPHSIDYELRESLPSLASESSWKSNVLDDHEKEYLCENISNFRFFNDTIATNNLCVIGKK
jgi:hypothetical protein